MELKELGSVPSTSAKQVLVVAKGSQEFISTRPKTRCFPFVTVGARGLEESGSKKSKILIHSSDRLADLGSLATETPTQIFSLLLPSVFKTRTR